MKQKAEATPKKPVGIWIRVSTEDQAQGDSPEHHEKRARYYAEAKEWNVVEVYRLEAVSGKAVMEHPEAKRMLSDVKTGRIRALIFSKLARLARNTKELLEFADFFRDHNADLVSLQESIDTSTPAGRLTYTVLSALAEWERAEIAERVAASVPIRAKLGKNTGGIAPFGYEWKDGKLRVHPAEGPVRKLLYDLFLEHRKKKRVARILNERGYRTRTGANFSDKTIYRLLSDPVGKGTRRANYTRQEGKNKKIVLKPESEWIHVPVEPIIDEETWDRVQMHLGANEKRGRKEGRPAVQLFGGLTYCACGAKMYVFKKSPKYVCGKCRNKIPCVDLEGVFHAQLKNMFLDRQAIEALFAEADGSMKEKGQLIAVLEKERHKIKVEMDKLYELYLDNRITKEGFGEKYHPLADRLRQIDEELPAAQAELDLMKIGYLSREEIASEARDLYSRWEGLSHEEKRGIIEAITERVTVGKDAVDITLYSVESFQNHPKKATQRQGCAESSASRTGG